MKWNRVLLQRSDDSSLNDEHVLVLITTLKEGGRIVSLMTRPVVILDVDYFFFNFLLDPASPIRPNPKRNIVLGSGIIPLAASTEKE